jgi:hypothetical protein
MLNPNLINLYNNWTAKANNYNNNDLANVFDKYITLFVIYNALYNQIVNELRNLGTHIYNRYDDRKAATDWLISFIGANQIINKINADELNEEINTIAHLIQDEVFHIKLNWGRRERTSDIKIMHRLLSNNNNEKAKGLLEVIYYVRCNLVHGHKQFENYQRDLLMPLTNLLSSINELVFDRLND